MAMSAFHFPGSSSPDKQQRGRQQSHHFLSPARRSRSAEGQRPQYKDSTRRPGFFRRRGPSVERETAAKLLPPAPTAPVTTQDNEPSFFHDEMVIQQTRSMSPGRTKQSRSISPSKGNRKGTIQNYNASSNNKTYQEFRIKTVEGHNNSKPTAAATRTASKRIDPAGDRISTRKQTTASLLMFSDAFDTNSALTGWSEQELIQKRAKKAQQKQSKKEKSYGKKKKKEARILNIPMALKRTGTDVVDAVKSGTKSRYHRGEDGTKGMINRGISTTSGGGNGGGPTSMKPPRPFSYTKEVDDANNQQWNIKPSLSSKSSETESSSDGRVENSKSRNQQQQQPQTQQQEAPTVLNPAAKRWVEAKNRRTDPLLLAKKRSFEEGGGVKRDAPGPVARRPSPTPYNAVPQQRNREPPAPIVRRPSPAPVSPAQGVTETAPRRVDIDDTIPDNEPGEELLIQHRDTSRDISRDTSRDISRDTTISAQDSADAADQWMRGVLDTTPDYNNDSTSSAAANNDGQLGNHLKGSPTSVMAPPPYSLALAQEKVNEKVAKATHMQMKERLVEMHAFPSGDEKEIESPEPTEATTNSNKPKSILRNLPAKSSPKRDGVYAIAKRTPNSDENQERIVLTRFSETVEQRTYENDDEEYYASAPGYDEYVTAGISEGGAFPVNPTTGAAATFEPHVRQDRDDLFFKHAEASSPWYDDEHGATGLSGEMQQQERSFTLDSQPSYESNNDPKQPNVNVEPRQEENVQESNRVQPMRPEAFISPSTAESFRTVESSDADLDALAMPLVDGASALTPEGEDVFSEPPQESLDIFGANDITDEEFDVPEDKETMFIRVVAAVVIQTAVRRFLAILHFARMIEALYPELLLEDEMDYALNEVLQPETLNQSAVRNEDSSPQAILRSLGHPNVASVSGREGPPKEQRKESPRTRKVQMEKPSDRPRRQESSRTRESKSSKHVENVSRQDRSKSRGLKPSQSAEKSNLQQASRNGELRIGNPVSTSRPKTRESKMIKSAETLPVRQHEASPRTRELQVGKPTLTLKSHVFRVIPPEEGTDLGHETSLDDIEVKLVTPPRKKAPKAANEVSTVGTEHSQQLSTPDRQLLLDRGALFSPTASRNSVDDQIEAAMVIQRVFRGWWVRDSIHVDHYCAKLIQRTTRGHLARTAFYFDIYRIIMIQSFVRMLIARSNSVDKLALVLAIQTNVRGFLARKKRREMMTEPEESEADDMEWVLYNESATKIQAVWRSHFCSDVFMNILADILLTQSCVRRWMVNTKTVPKLKWEREQSMKKEEAERKRLADSKLYITRINTSPQADEPLKQPSNNPRMTRLDQPPSKQPNNNPRVVKPDDQQPLKIPNNKNPTIVRPRRTAPKNSAVAFWEQKSAQAKPMFPKGDGRW